MRTPLLAPLALVVGTLSLSGCATRERGPSAAPEGAARAPRPNPFAGARFYVNPDYARAVEAAAAASPGEAARVRRVASQPVGIWIDSAARAKRIRGYLDDALAQQKASGEPVVVTLVLYDMPNRDCAAKASAGELSVENGGEARYRAEVVDPVAAELRRYPTLRVAVIVEPDSLANLATNLNVPKCAASEQVYRRSVAYAVATLAMPHVSLYLDAAHAGWLGWDGNRAKIARVFKEVLDEAGGADKIRGFATNVSNYNAVRGGDGARLEPSDPCPDELTYVQKLSATLATVGIEGKGFVIDTSRNGRAGIRARWGHWCNVRGAGLGPRPQASPEPLVDAYYWVKPPGESDGTSDPSAGRFDQACASPDSAPNAPEAGAWFGAYFGELVKNADPPL